MAEYYRSCIKVVLLYEALVSSVVIQSFSAHSYLVFLLPESHIGPVVCNAPFGNSLSSAECTS